MSEFNLLCTVMRICFKLVNQLLVGKQLNEYIRVPLATRRIIKQQTVFKDIETRLTFTLQTTDFNSSSSATIGKFIRQSSHRSLNNCSLICHQKCTWSSAAAVAPQLNEEIHKRGRERKRERERRESISCFCKIVGKIDKTSKYTHVRATAT